MKTHNPAKRSSLFLMELMIAILFFSLASAVCVQLFVKSHLLTREAADLNQAVSQAQSAAEVIRTTAVPPQSANFCPTPLLTLMASGSTMIVSGTSAKRKMPNTCFGRICLFSRRCCIPT